MSWRCENFYSSCPKVPKSPKGDDQGNLWNLNSCLQIMGIHFFTGWWCFSIESISVMDSIIDFEQSLSVCEMWVCDQWSCKQQVVWVPVPAKRKTALAHIIHVHFWKWYLVSNFSRESIKVIKVWNNYAISSSTPKKPVSNRERKNIQISQTIFVVCASVLLKLFMDIYLLKAPLANFQMNEGWQLYTSKFGKYF